MKNDAQKPDDATLIVRRLLNATPERAFERWTSAEHIQQWMRPEPGMVVPLASIDLRAGGKFRIQMKMPDGEFFTAVGVFKEIKAGRTTIDAALRTVKQARRRADKVRRLLRELGDTDEHRALGERFHRTSERLEAGNSDDATKAKYADLILEVHHLKLQAHDKFYTQTQAHEHSADGAKKLKS